VQHHVVGICSTSRLGAWAIPRSALHSAMFCHSTCPPLSQWVGGSVDVL